MRYGPVSPTSPSVQASSLHHLCPVHAAVGRPERLGPPIRHVNIHTNANTYAHVLSCLVCVNLPHPLFPPNYSPIPVGRTRVRAVLRQSLLPQLWVVSSEHSHPLTNDHHPLPYQHCSTTTTLHNTPSTKYNAPCSGFPSTLACHFLVNAGPRLRLDSSRALGAAPSPVDVGQF